MKNHPNCIYSSLHWRSLICAHNLGFHNGFSICLYISIVNSIFESVALCSLSNGNVACTMLLHCCTFNHSMQSNAPE